MARWRLTQKHYLNVPGTEFEYKETTHYGKQIKKNFAVPMYLDPESPNDCNYSSGGEHRNPSDINNPGEIIVAWDDGTQKSRDIIFVGLPTIDMVPLDDSAREVSEGMSKKWGRAFIGEDEDEGGYSNKLLSELTETLQSFNSTAKPSSTVADDSRVSRLEEQLNKVLDMNTKLIEKLEPPARRV